MQDLYYFKNKGAQDVLSAFANVMCGLFLLFRTFICGGCRAYFRVGFFAVDFDISRACDDCRTCSSSDNSPRRRCSDGPVHIAVRKLECGFFA